MRGTTNRDRRERASRPNPIRIDLAIEVPTSQRRLFSYLSDLENNPDWNWAVKTTTPLRSGPPRRGAQYIQQRTTPSTGEDLLEITDLRPDDLVQVTGDIDEGHIRYRYLLTPLTPARTRLRTLVEFEPSDRVTRNALYTARLKAAISNNLESLSSLICGADAAAAEAAAVR